MGYSELSIPTDIPWKRLAVSGDMLDPRHGDLRFPRKWDTSIAAFYHEPPETDPAYCQRRLTYIKIVCTITNYQLAANDVTILDRLRTTPMLAAPYREFELNATRAYPCHGALLQVGVYPNPDENVPLHDFPYVASMQPRKRELYEVATQSGEVASQSANKLNVMKGGTTTGTTEDYDLDMGGGSGGHSGVFGLWSEQHSNEQKQVGTIQRNQTQNQNVSTTDASRERRETYSFSTSINQLHTLLQSYHLGTNRVMFFMQPVPHMQDAKFSFVRGLRRIEGVQEFFLIINRPARVPGFCLEIALETAHLYVRHAYTPRLIPLSDAYSPTNLAKTEEAIGSAVKGNSAYQRYRDYRDAWNSLWPWERKTVANPQWDPYGASDIWLTAGEVPVRLPDIGIEDVALIYEQYEAHTGEFFVSGRRFCACWLPTPHEPIEEEPDEAGEEVHEPDEHCEDSSPASISTCDIAPGSIVFSDLLGGGGYTLAGAKTAQFSNGLTADLNRALSSSLLSPERKAYGRGSFFETEFMLEELSELVRRTARLDTDISNLKAFREGPRELLRKFKGAAVLREFAGMTTATMMSTLSMDAASARRLKCDVLLEVLEQSDARLPHTVDREEATRGVEDRATREARLIASGRGDARPQRETKRATVRKRPKKSHR
ncbi:hypothetical protein [Peristeroidobacter agariperforans]|uniref:hypothetical protein n=1 Tax=Peristeroidobacter agariperforans TaxID=268404 RepID=UPI00101E1B3B|nr:hypothetical protein [Peristeroidobacter agariperforans]